jgi:hypothetical protein
VKEYTVSGPSIPSKTFVLLRQCIASVIFHFDFLNTHLHSSCKLRVSPLFTSIPQSIRDAVVIGYPWDKATASTPAFSSLPSHVVLMSQMKELKISFEQQIKDMREQVKLDMAREFDKR